MEGGRGCARAGGGKNTIWEGGTRLASAVKGPGIKLTGITFELMHGADLLPTLLTVRCKGRARPIRLVPPPPPPPSPRHHLVEGC